MMTEHEEAWRDYDHGFRDGYQAARRELPEACPEGFGGLNHFSVQQSS